MALTFPLTVSWDELAEYPDADSFFSWDNSMIEPGLWDNLAAFIKSYADELHVGDPTDPQTTSYKASPYYNQLPDYLHAVGFKVSDAGLTIETKNALYLAHSIFTQVSEEYDSGAPSDEWPTWKLFNLGGDDSADYYGGQPSCITGLIIQAHEDFEAHPTEED